MSDFLERDRRTAALLEDAYVAAGPGPGGSGSTDRSEGTWRAKRQHLAVPMDDDGTWLDVGCANGHPLVTLPRWASERGLRIEPHGLELLPRLADLARSLHPGARGVDLDRIGDVVNTSGSVPVRHDPRRCGPPWPTRRSRGQAPARLRGSSQVPEHHPSRHHGEVSKYNVLPLDDRRVERFTSDLAGRPVLVEGNRQLLFGGMGRLSENSMLNLKMSWCARGARLVRRHSTRWSSGPFVPDLFGCSRQVAVPA